MIKLICPKTLLIALTAVLISGCSKKNQEALVLWTDNVEFASYAELFNASQDEVKVATLYKTGLIDSLPVAKGNKNPDIIAGSFIATDLSRQFSSLNRVFNDDITEDDFYPSLLEAGKKGKTQYLLPVSFNLGTFVYDVTNSDLIEGNPTSLTIEQIKDYSSKFNTKTKDDIYSKMAFAPQWNPEFLYTLLTANQVNFSVEAETLKFNLPLLESCCNSVSEWTNTINTSSNDERDFAFKYLYTPFNKQVLQQKSMFAYTSSRDLLSLSEDQLEKINFCWFSYNDNSPVLEDMTMIGIYKKASNKKAALKFIQWFMTESAQEAMLKRRLVMNLDTNTFGIANGFSSLTSVNEHILPVYYKCLLAKIPSASFPTKPYAYSSQWPLIKREIIIPYLLEDLSGKRDIQVISKRYTEWVNQNKEE